MVNAMTVNSHAKNHYSTAIVMNAALDAAIEVERLLLGKRATEEVIESLLGMLPFKGTSEPRSVSSQLIHDPRDVEIYRRAIDSASRVRVNDMDELDRSVESVIEGFKCHSSGSNNNGLEKFRDFCLALHRELLAESSRVRGEDATPYAGRTERIKYS